MKEGPTSQSNPAIDLSIKTVVIEEVIDEQSIIVAGNPNARFIVGFEKPALLQSASFEAENNMHGIVMRDNIGNHYDLGGKIVRGPNEGMQLSRLNGMMAYWFAVAAFYPNVEISGSDILGSGEVPLANIEEWLVSSDFIFSGAGMDAIPAIEETNFTNFQASIHDLNESFFVEDDELCIVVNIGNEYKVYPHSILDWHEIVNDEIAGIPISIVYCPLTGSASVWSRNINGSETTFGVSGLLYNNNIIPYDRATNTRWSQVYNQAIHGELIGEFPEQYTYFQAPWIELQKLNAPLKVLSRETGFSRDYDEYPYGDYDINDDFLLFPSSHIAERIPNKELVYLVEYNGLRKAFPLSSFIN